MILFFKSIFSFILSFVILSIPVGNKPLFDILFRHTAPVTNSILKNVQLNLDKGIDGTKKLITAKSEKNFFSEEEFKYDDEKEIEQDLTLTEQEPLIQVTKDNRKNIKLKEDVIKMKLSGVKKHTAPSNKINKELKPMENYSAEEENALNSIILQSF